MTRTYELRKRADAMEATRQRIVEATIGLHSQRGDAGTTIAEVARRAGVSRVTVYRHFPDERALLAACTGHYFAQHRPPDPDEWTTIADPLGRLASALRRVYGWFRETEVMVARGEEDAPTNPVLAELLAPLAVAWDCMRDELDAAWPARSPLRRAAIGHALAFQTWRSLRRGQGLTDDEAIELMVTAVRGVSESRSGDPGPDSERQ